MKCPNCGANVEKGQNFCYECGHDVRNVTQNTIICPQCGCELSDGTKFCSYCGTKISAETLETSEQETPFDNNASASHPINQTTAPSASESDEAPDVDADSVEYQSGQGASVSQSKSNHNIKTRLLTFWNGLDLFGRISTIVIAVVAILLLISISAGNGFAIIFSLLQLVGSIVAFLMHKGIIKLDEKEKRSEYLILAIAVLLTILNIASYSWTRDGQKEADSSKPLISDTTEASPTPVITTVVVPYSAGECSGQNYLAVKKDFSSAGFTNIKTEEIQDIEMAGADELDTVVSVSIGDVTDFTEDQEFNPNDEVLIRYHSYMQYDVTAHIAFIPNLIFSTYDVDFLVDGSRKGTLDHGEDQDFSFSVDPGEHTLTFESADSSSIKGTIALTVDCDVDISYKIYCRSDKISIEMLSIDYKRELTDNEAKVNVSASEYKYENYEYVVSALKDLGFTNIQLEVLYDIVVGWTDEGEVDSVSIAGNSDFICGDIFAKDDPVVITYHMNEEDDPNRPVETEPPTTETEESDSPTVSESVSYSTNDSDTV